MSYRRKASIESSAEALPEYYNAIKALDSLDKKDIQEAHWHWAEHLQCLVMIVVRFS
jgi:hypothetical protein